MNPINRLMEEHQVILTVLDSLDRFGAAIEANQTCDQVQLGRFATFIREYADAYHHAKEENVLFEAMVENGFSKQSGPVAVMLYEHEEGRKIARFLRETAAKMQDLTSGECLTVSQAIRNFSALLRSHISKEDNILYPMARERIHGSALLAMTNRFEKIESEIEAKGEVVKLESLANNLTGIH